MHVQNYLKIRGDFLLKLSVTRFSENITSDLDLEYRTHPRPGRVSPRQTGLG